MPAPAAQQSSCSKASTVRAVSLHAATVLASLIAASVMLVACGPGASRAQGTPGAGGPPPAAVVVMSLAATNLAMNYEYVGQTAGSRDIEVRARVAGILLKRNFDEGRAVRRGEALYTQDTAPFRVALDRADAASSYSRWLTARASHSGFRRFKVRVACASLASEAATSASARLNAAWNGSGSRLYSDWPFLTLPPSVKLRASRIPATRARTSTSREPAVWPTYS